ncbi:hypothetical protein QTO34_000309 [Cnephaeus nilssonii]|uniref:Integrator complex subunit 6-like beta-barrel domain-containing protein n=1 Tax=Cnephaeus nilssonii TaxID=3371016 RepID=A0AA40LWE9_CNENI|nr:hypothetical protein QTO34_000309 [Eptesicus nilssonii]
MGPNKSKTRWDGGASEQVAPGQGGCERGPIALLISPQMVTSSCSRGRAAILMTQGEGGVPGGPGASQGPEVSLNLSFHARHSGFDLRVGLGPGWWPWAWQHPASLLRNAGADPQWFPAIRAGSLLVPKARKARGFPGLGLGRTQCPCYRSQEPTPSGFLRSVQAPCWCPRPGKPRAAFPALGSAAPQRPCNGFLVGVFGGRGLVGGRGLGVAKAGWKENHATFMSELKNLQASGLTTLGQALRSSFDLLNLNRLISGIDNYGQGRNPFFLEPSILITITDGNKLTSTAGVQEELHLPLNSPLPGSELTKEPFRWDQRLFALVLRLPGLASTEPEQLGSVPTDESAITQMCEVTGGRSYCVRTQRMLNQCLESLVQKVQSGVVINFEKTGPDPLLIGEDGLMDSSRPNNSFAAQPWHSCHKLIYVRPNSKTGVPVGHWPIPESFWPDQNLPSLPPRTSHPVVRFSCVDCEPMVIDKLPFDKYELEPSPLTQYILERKSPHTCWQES